MTSLLNNRYKIIRTLGRGGFGETYLTEDTHMPSGRRCVLKQLKPMVKQPKIPLWMKERFGREAAILEELGDGSNQIPQLYAYFSENDKFYLVQEWIEGQTLEQYWSQEGNLHRDEVRQILLQLLPVLKYVHSRHIIHRDIKPENIILRKEDKLPFLIDFGAVKEAIASQVNQNSNSTYSASIGTPGYMSSEQAAGRPIYSSDLYSLGLTAIALLTGKAPHELETDPRNGEIIWQEHAFNLDSQLAAVIDRAIRFHPRDRFASAQEMLNALKHQDSVNRTTSATGATLNIAPKRITMEDSLMQQSGNTRVVSQPQRAKKRSWLTTAVIFLLIAVGVAVGTFATGFAVISNLLQSDPTPQRAKVERDRQPDLFSDPAEVAEAKTAKQREEAARKARLEEAANEVEPKTESDLDLVEPEPQLNKPPKTVAVVEPEQATEINIPILTTGTSESQLVSTLGEPNSERKGWRPNTKVLAYYNVVPERVNLSYESDDTGQIRQTNVALAQSVDLDVMEQTLAKMLGDNVPADIKDKLRNIYDRQSNFSFFKLNDLEGKFQRDAKDRINISVWERGF